MIKHKKHFYLVVTVLFIATVVSIICSCFLGAADISFGTVVEVIKGSVFGGKIEGIEDSSMYIIHELRVPRTILAIFIGGGLAVAGVAMQALTQNVLAEPYMLGVSSGALTCVSFAILINTSIYYTKYGIFIAAFIGAIVSLVLVYLISGVSNKGSNNRLILGGMAVSIVLSALSNLFIIISPNDSSLKNLVSWSMGSLAGARWNNIALPCTVILFGVLLFTITSRNYDIMSLGEETAINMGVHVRSVKKWTIILIALIAGVAVASAGLIGLVGFIIPHIVRSLLGAQHRKLFPLSFLVGGLFLIWMDIIARTVASPSDLPIGIFTALFGGPFFIWLLVKKR